MQKIDKKKLKTRKKKNNLSEYVFLDSQIGRNMEDERNVSSEFHRMMRLRRNLHENFESGFIKSLKTRKKSEVRTEEVSGLSMIAGCGSSTTGRLLSGNVNDDGTFLNLSVDSCSDALSSNIDVEEYVKSVSSLRKNYQSKSYDNLIFKLEKKSDDNEKQLRASVKSSKRYSEEDLHSFLDKNQSQFYYDKQHQQCDTFPKSNPKKIKGLTGTKKKRSKLTSNFKSGKTNLILVDNVNVYTSSVQNKADKPSLFERINTFVNKWFGWKSSSDKKDNSTVRNNMSNLEGSSNYETENITTVYQVSISQNAGECSTSCLSNVQVERKNNVKRSLFTRLHTASLSFPFRKWFTGKSRQFHSTGELFDEQFGPNEGTVRRFIEFPDEKKFVDFSRAYYPLTKWTLINRLFRQKTLSGSSVIQVKTGGGDEKMKFPSEIFLGSVRDRTEGEGSKSDVIPVSLTDVKIEDAVKVNGEKRSQDDDEDECGSGWGYWLEYLMVLFVSVILLLGCVFLVLFWCFYYKKGYNSWKVERDQQFNLHPTLMVGAVVFTGFSVLMYRIGRCSRRLYVKLLHATFHLLAILCFVGGFLSIFEWHNMTSLTHFYSLHSWIGFITMGLFGIQFLVGFVSFLVLLCCESATAGFRACLLPLHTTFGLTIFLISIATCLTGLVQRTNSTIGEENYPSLPEEAIVVNALGVALVAVGVAVTYALGRTSLRVKSDCYISERL